MVFGALVVALAALVVLFDALVLGALLAVVGAAVPPRARRGVAGHKGSFPLHDRKRS